MAAWQHARGRERLVLFSIPLAHEAREQRGEIVLARYGQAARTIGAARALAGAARRAGLVAVPAPAHPPELFLAAVSDLLRRQLVLLAVPFLEQRRITQLPAVVIERFAHGIPLPHVKRTQSVLCLIDPGRTRRPLFLAAFRMVNKRN